MAELRVTTKQKARPVPTDRKGCEPIAPPSTDIHCSMVPQTRGCECRLNRLQKGGSREYSTSSLFGINTLLVVAPSSCMTRSPVVLPITAVCLRNWDERTFFCLPDYIQPQSNQSTAVLLDFCRLVCVFSTVSGFAVVRGKPGTDYSERVLRTTSNRQHTLTSLPLPGPSTLTRSCTFLATSTSELSGAVKMRIGAGFSFHIFSRSSTCPRISPR